MKNDWSLKDKAIKIMTNPHGKVITISCPRPDIPREIEWLEEYFYSTINIETLRQKLIDDIKKEWEYTGQIHNAGDIIRIINRCFGEDD